MRACNGCYRRGVRPPRPSLTRSTRRHVIKDLLHLPPHDHRIKIAGDGDHGLSGVIVALVKSGDILNGGRTHAFRGTDDRAAQGGLIINGFLEKIPEIDFRIIHPALHLFQNHGTFFRPLAGIERRAERQFAQNIDRRERAFGRRVNVVMRKFARGFGVHVTARPFHAAGDLLRGKAARALEHHVFQNMGQSRARIRFIHRTHFDPNVRGNHRPAPVRFQQHFQPVGKLEMVDARKRRKLQRQLRWPW